MRKARQRQKDWKPRPPNLLRLAGLDLSIAVLGAQAVRRWCFCSTFQAPWTIGIQRWSTVLPRIAPWLFSTTQALGVQWQDA